MGLFEHYETISLQRCVRPKKAAYLIGAYFLDPSQAKTDAGLQAVYCEVTFTTPYPLLGSVAAPAGVAAIAAFISFILCCMEPVRTVPKPLKQAKET